MGNFKPYFTGNYSYPLLGMLLHHCFHKASWPLPSHLLLHSLFKWLRQTYSYLLATLPPEIARLSEHGDQQEMVLRQGGCHNSARAQPLWTETPMNYIFPWCYMSKAAEFVQHMDATASEHSLGSRNPCGYSTAPSMGRNAWLVLSGS